MNMCMLEVAMREKCRSSHFQSKGVLLLGEGGGGGSVAHYMPLFDRYKILAKEAIHFNFLQPYALPEVVKGTFKYLFSVFRCLSLFITCYCSVVGQTMTIFVRT